MRWAGGFGAVVAAACLWAPLAHAQSSYYDDQASNATTQSTVTRVATTKTINVIQGRIGGAGNAGARRTGSSGGVAPQQTSSVGVDPILDAHRTGDAAGNNPLGLGVWGSFNYSAIKDDHSSTETGGDIYSGVVGSDYMITDKLVAGAAFTFEVVDLEAEFVLGTQDSYGVGITPYLAYSLLDNVSVSAMAGYTHTFGDSTRRAGAVNSGALVTADYETDRYFFATQLDGFYDIGNFSIGASTGVLVAQERTYSFTESNGNRVSGSTTELGSYNVGLIGSYFIGVSRSLFLEPYISYRYDTDFMRDDIKVAAGFEEHANDHDGHTVGAGVNMYLDDNMSGGLDFQTTMGRQKQESYSGTVSFRIQF